MDFSQNDDIQQDSPVAVFFRKLSTVDIHF